MSSTEITDRQITPSPVIVEVQNVPPQETPSHSLSSRASSRTSENYSYSDSFETSSFEQEIVEKGHQTTSLEQDDYSDVVSYLDTFESESSVPSSDETFTQPNDSGTDTELESSALCSGVLDKRTVFDVSEFSLFQDLPEKPYKISSVSLDTSPRLEGEMKKTEYKISQQSLKEQKEKEVFIGKCLQRIQDPEKAFEQTDFEYDDCLKQFLDTVITNVSKKTLHDPKTISSGESKSRSEIKKEKLLRSKFEAPPSVLAKIRMKNLMDTMDEASAVRIHDPKKCNTCNTHRNRVEASLARERFLRCKVNDLTRKKTEIKIEDHLIEMANLCL